MRVLHGNLDERANLDRAAEAHRRNPLRELQCVVQVGRVDHVVAAEHLLGVGIRAVDDQVLTAAVANRRRRIGRLQVGATEAPGVLAKRPVLGVYRLVLVLP